MQFHILGEGKKAVMLVEQEAFSGVKKIAGKVKKDLELVTGKEYVLLEDEWMPGEAECIIFAGTLGNSGILDLLKEDIFLDTDRIEGKRECYFFEAIAVTEKMREKIPALKAAKQLLVIGGSDKRGTIYGLFHLSELTGVSPWLYWADVMPEKKDSIVLTEELFMVSKEPSVKYRGFFINDEWPSFGNWTMKHFGGFTAEMYDHVFELLLRLKGNYLWPAMWTSSFSLDGPGLLNAELADEYGIVMSNSHHEPCLRHSEEWDLVRGDASIYKNAWNFDQNKEGLTAYWRDGLIRNGKFENIITIGMRGERDSTILGHDANLEDNINYLKEVIVTQNQLIRECVNEDLDKVPRMLAVYKEVEEYFYGDDTTPGLSEWEGLDGVTLMLCEDNFGNMRKLPEKEKRNRRGGYGMYYHFDYHGDPISYEWINSTHLLKVWEQMGMAYEMGIRDIWVVNVGDLKPQELPLSYFLDLAYDFDTWGRKGAEQAQIYTRQWVKQQFGKDFTEEELEELYFILEGYTKLNSIRKPEALQPDTYHPVHYREADRVLQKVAEIEEKAEGLLKKADAASKEEGKEDSFAAFYELIYFPAMAAANLLKMQISAGRNKLYAEQGRISANRYADLIENYIKADRMLQENYHNLNNKKWAGIMLSEHIGFQNWNDEGCQYPQRIYIEPANKPRMIVSAADDTIYTTGENWTKKTLYIRNFMSPYEDEAVLEIANGGRDAFDYAIACDAEWLQVSSCTGTVKDTVQIILGIDREKLSAEGHREQTAHLQVKSDFASANVEIAAMVFSKEMLQAPFVSENGVAIEAADYVQKTDGKKGSYVSISELGKYRTAVKAFPVSEEYRPGEDAPSLTYELCLPENGTYEITFLSTPSNPISIKNKLRFGFRWNEEDMEIINSVEDNYKGGTHVCSQWAQGVLDQIHTKVIKKEGKKGINRFEIYACDAAFVLERILVIPEGQTWKQSYMGPQGRGEHI